MQNADLLTKIGADTAAEGPNFARNLLKFCQDFENEVRARGGERFARKTVDFAGRDEEERRKLSREGPKFAK